MLKARPPGSEARPLIDGGIFSRKSDQVKLKEILGLYNLNLNQVVQTWNFNRWFVLLGHHFRIVDRVLTMKLSERRDSPRKEVSSRLYRPLFGMRHGPQSSATADVIVVAQHGRFGNMVRQVTLALGTAEQLGIREVIVKSFPQFPLGTWLLDNGVALTHDRHLRSRIVARPRVVLGGDFFVRQRLPVEVSHVDFDLISTSLAYAGRLLTLEPFDPNVMVIHLRSGDAFSNNPHPALGQPPFSFYKKVIEHEKPAKIVLVFENENNPVVGRLVEFADSINLDYQLQSESFEVDLAVLLAARTLVTARGTLAEALLSLSPNITTWISFSQCQRLFFRRRSIPRRIEVFDREGDYTAAILAGNWSYSSEQREIMLNYPVEKLALSEVWDES